MDQSHPNLDKIEPFISEDKILSRVKELAEQITNDFRGEELIVVCVLRGSFMLTSDLVKELGLACRVEFIKVSSYGDQKTSSGQVQLTMDLTEPIEDKNVLIVEDIVDTGHTMKYLLELLKVRRPKALKLASLLYKPARNEHPIDIDYLGFEIEDKFVVGYGLDYAGMYRELPFVGVMKGE